MDKVYLRSLFLSEKDFLSKLHKAEGGNTLTFASDKSLDTVIRILHLIANGHISLRKEDETVLRNAKKLNALNKFASKSFFHAILRKGTREEKLKDLKQFNKLYPILLHSFFKEV